MTRIGTLIFQFEVWIALILVAVSIYEPEYLPVGLAGFFIIFCLRFFIFKHFTKHTWADLLIVIIFLMSVVSLLISIDPQRTREQTMRLWIGIGMFYSIINWVDSRSRLRLLVSVIILAGFFLALITPFITAWNLQFLLPEFTFYRVIPTITDDPANPNVIAGSLSLFFLLCFGMLLLGWKFVTKIEKLLLLLTLVSTMFLLLFTQSRGAIISAVLSGIVVISIKIKKGWLIPILTILAVILLGERGNSYQYLESLTGGSAISGVVGRVEIWSRAIFMLEDYPYTGIGIGLFGPVADTLYPFYEYSTQLVEHAHNIFLQIGVDLGIPGLISWIAILGLSIMSAAQIVRREKGTWLMSLGAGLLASQVSIILHGLTDSVLWGMVRPSPLIWIFWGLIYSAFSLSVRFVDEKTR